MRNYRWILFTTCSVFLLTWLPHMVSGLIPAETDVAGLSDLSLVSLSSGLLTTPIIHPGQVSLVSVWHVALFTSLYSEQGTPAGLKEAAHKETQDGGELQARYHPH